LLPSTAGKKYVNTESLFQKQVMSYNYLEEVYFKGKHSSEKGDGHTQARGM